MRTPNEIIEDINHYVGAEIGHILELRAMPETQASRLGASIRDARRMRTRLMPMLQEAAELRDIDTLLAIERAFLRLELEYLGEAPIKVSSLDNAIRELDAAMLMLSYVRNPGYYQDFNQCFSLEKNRRNGQPNDQARQFFESHRTRLKNIEKGRMEEGERNLLSAREQNIQLARELYIELQQEAHAGTGIREPAAGYGRSEQFFELAKCA